MSRSHHLSNVVPLRRPTRINPAHPSMYDRAAEAPEAVVVLTRVEATAVASLLRSARAHLSSPKACDEAIELLAGRRR